MNSGGKVISRGVTSCAGMTAQHFLLAQTKIGFLTGGRGGNNFQELSDMKGLLGAATVVGCLQHGAGVCEQQHTDSPLLVALTAGSLARSRGDEDFLGPNRGVSSCCSCRDLSRTWCSSCSAATLDASTSSLWTYAIRGKWSLRLTSSSIDKCWPYGTPGQLVPRPFPSGGMKLGSVDIRLAMGLMTLTNLFSWCGLKGRNAISSCSMWRQEITMMCVNMSPQVPQQITGTLS